MSLADADFSPNALLITQTAAEEAKKRNHPQVGSEHLLWALFCVQGDQPRATSWLLAQGVSKDAVLEWLDSLAFFAPRSSSAVTPELSPRSTQVLKIAKNLGRGTIKSDSVVGAILVEGTNVAAQILCSPGVLTDDARAALQAQAQAKQQQVQPPPPVSAAAILAAMGRDKMEFARARRGTGSSCFSQFTIAAAPAPAAAAAATAVAGGESKAATTAEAEAGAGDSAALGEWTPPPLPSESNRSMRGPTARSNWLVPGLVLMGACPWDSATIELLLGAGVTTFSCLMEMSDEEYMSEYYPTAVQALADKGSLSRPVSFLHFPIDDFDIPEESDMVAFLGELSTRVKRGEVIYIHCLGGHGRTGTVASLLLSALYGLSAEAAMTTVRYFHNTRHHCGDYHCDLPETRAQSAQVKKKNWHMSREQRKAAPAPAAAAAAGKK